MGDVAARIASEGRIDDDGRIAASGGVDKRIAGHRKGMTLIVCNSWFLTR